MFLGLSVQLSAVERTLQSLVFTLCTIRINIKKSIFCQMSSFMCFVFFLEQITIISLYSINWLGFFITETESVYCAVQPESLTLIQVNLMKYVKAMSRCRMFKSTNVSEPYRLHNKNLKNGDGLCL